MKKRIAELKKMVNLYGAAQVAVWLGYKDTHMVKQWITRGHIPEVRQVKVDDMLNQYGGSKNGVRNNKR